MGHASLAAFRARGASPAYELTGARERRQAAAGRSRALHRKNPSVVLASNGARIALTPAVSRHPTTVSARRRDLYAILGLAPEATAAEINHAYRALVRRHHPDTRDANEHAAGDDADKELERVQAAYAVLRDPQLRADYDAHIDVARRRARRPPPSAESPGGSAGGSATGDGAHRATPKAPRYRTAEPQPPFRAGPVRWEPPPIS